MKYMSDEKNQEYGDEMEFIKALIQQSIWKMYNESGEIEYKQLYDKWSKNTNKIIIMGLE